MMLESGKSDNSAQPSVVAIIQARMNSTRLPAKSMKDLAGKPILAHMIERAQSIKHVSHVIVATGNPEDNGAILTLAENMGAHPFSGSDDNVLNRFYQASQIWNSDYIIRLTGDNPFTDVNLANLAVKHAFKTEADLSSVSDIPLGTAVELIKTSALQKCFLHANKAYHFEHVTPYIKEHPEQFTIKRKPVYIYNMIDNLRLTIDTHEDFILAEKIYTHLYKGKPFSLHQVLNFLKINQELIHINSSISQRPMTHCESANETGPLINSL